MRTNNVHDRVHLGEAVHLTKGIRIALVVFALLTGCSKPVPPPHALEDASTAAQRASESMRATNSTAIDKNAAENPAGGGVQEAKGGKAQ
jgi:hypothetical protein